jgi:hypothetical protein
MNKMTLRDLKDMFLRKNISLQRIRPTKHIGSKTGFLHAVAHTYKPPKSDMTPKKWEEQQRMFKKSIALKVKKKLNYECPDCEIKQSLGKLDWCEIHQKWSVLKEKNVV